MMPSPDRFLKILFTLLLILTGLFTSEAVQAQTGGSDGQHRPVPNLDVIILVDESETMWIRTDPANIRVNAVNYFIDILTSDQAGGDHRVAVIPFGTEPSVIPFASLNDPAAVEALKAEFTAIHNRLEQNKNTQYTDINAVLQAALDLLDQHYDPNRKPAIILISDGQPTSPKVSERRGRDTVENYLTETKTLLEQFQPFQYGGDTCSTINGVPLYTIGMGVDKLAEVSTPDFLALYREFWQGVASTTGGYYREAGRLQEMQGISTYIFSELLCTPATPPLTLRSSQVLEYQVFKSYYQIIFTISGKENPELQAQIYRPNEDGTPGERLLQKDEEGVSWQEGPDYEVWRVRYNEPWSGTWRVTLEGDGQAEFSYIIFPNVTLNVTEPNSGFLPVDKPFTLRANIAAENGQPLDVPVSNLLVEVEGEDVRKQVSLTKQGDTYAAEIEPLGETGEYSLTFSGLLPDGTPIFEHKWVTLISAPWAEIAKPATTDAYRPEDNIPVEAEVHLAGAIPLDGIKMIATVRQNDETVETIELSRGRVVSQGNDENIVLYNGQFRPVAEAGDYVVQAKLTAILPGGRVFDYETSPVTLAVQLPPSPTATPEPEPAATITPTVVAKVATPSPTATSTPAAAFWSPFLAGLASGEGKANTYWPCLALLLLLLLLIPLGLWWRRRRETTPDKIKLLATLMRSRKESGEPPYLLILGSGAAMVLGSRSMKRVVEAIAHCEDLEQFHKQLDGFSPMERYVLLKKHFDEVDLSPGYRQLAELVAKGYFNLIFTTNLDPFVEKSLANGHGATANHEVIICGKQPAVETLEKLKNAEPPVKIIKLHGDVRTRNFAFTPSEVSTFGGDSERVLRQYLSQDLIIIGHGSRDYDINRAIDQHGGSIWYVNYTPPSLDNPLYRAMRARRAEANVIDGEYGLFDRFFEALHRELTKTKP